ncbi:MAG: hypothetical protein M3O32_17200 [Actinomycetota bacterium]|nr:hypothetical protein [Actinomycetota bacterium]
MTGGPQAGFRWAVTAVAVALVASSAVAWVTRDTDNTRAAAIRERLKPASDALRVAARPAGFAACANRDEGELCWEGQGTEVAAVPQLVSSLQGVGATELAPRCIRTERLKLVLCRVEGKLKGAWLDSLISTSAGHLKVVVFAATQPPPNILRGGTPIPLRPLVGAAAVG